MTTREINDALDEARRGVTNERTRKALLALAERYAEVVNASATLKASGVPA